MHLILKPSGGQNVVLRPQARPRYYPDPTAKTATVEVSWGYADEGAGQARFLGHFAPGQMGSFPYTPDLDRHVRLYSVSRSASGVPSVSVLEDAEQASVPFQRETEAPVIGQNEPATAAEVRIGIDGFTRFARLRRVTVSANDDMSDPLEVLLFDSDDYKSKELPRYFVLERSTGEAILTEGGLGLTTEGGETLTTEAGALPLTVYVTVAHSSGTAWTPESNILEVTFAAEDGTGGSGGDFDPRPTDRHKLEPIV
jgi:hypothetical protein